MKDYLPAVQWIFHLSSHPLLAHSRSFLLKQEKIDQLIYIGFILTILQAVTRLTELSRIFHKC